MIFQKFPEFGFQVFKFYRLVFHLFHWWIVSQIREISAENPSC